MDRREQMLADMSPEEYRRFSLAAAWLCMVLLAFGIIGAALIATLYEEVPPVRIGTIRSGFPTYEERRECPGNILLRGDEWECVAG